MCRPEVQGRKHSSMSQGLPSVTEKTEQNWGYSFGPEPPFADFEPIHFETLTECEPPLSRSEPQQPRC